MHQPEPPDGAVPCWQLVFLMAIGPILFFVTGSLLDDNERLLVIGGGGKRKRKAHLVDASTATVEDAVVLPSGSLQMGPCSWCGKTEPYPKPKKPKYLKQYMRDLLAKFQGLHSNCQPITAAQNAADGLATAAGGPATGSDVVDASTATVKDAVVLPSGSLQMGPCSWCGKTEPYPKPKKPKYLKQYMRDLLAKFQGLHSNCQPIAAAVRAKRP